MSDDILKASRNLLEALDELLHDGPYTTADGIIDSLHEGGHYKTREHAEELFEKIRQADSELRLAIKDSGPS